MLAAERRRIITERIKATGQVVVSSLSAEFAVSEETIRRDLEALERDGIAVRIYGGAVLAGNDRVAPPYSIRKNTNVEPKVAIAQRLAGLLKDGDTLMVGPHTLRTVQSYHVRFAILSCRGINKELGLADSDDEVVAVKQAMLRSCDKALLLADHRKFDRTGLVSLGDLRSVDKLITDAPPSPEWQKRLANAGVELVCDQ